MEKCEASTNKRSSQEFHELSGASGTTYTASSSNPSQNKGILLNMIMELMDTLSSESEDEEEVILNQLLKVNPCDIIERENVRNISADEIEGEGVDDVESEARSTCVAAADLVNNYNESKFATNNESDKEKTNDDNTTSLKSQTTSSQTLAVAAEPFGETQTIATAHKQNVAEHHQNQRQFVKDFREQILHGQQINVNSLLDVAGSPGSTEYSMGTLYDMAAFSKLDCSPLGDLKNNAQNCQDFLAKKYYHPLYAHGVCRWPGCEMPLEDMATFVKHLKSEHCLDDRSTAQARVQMQVVSQLEMHLQKERDRLQAMMHHLYLTKHFSMTEATQAQENISHIRYKNAVRSVSTTPDLNKINSNSNDDSDGVSDLSSLILSPGNMSSTRKRICDKSPLALVGGLPYMLERAGLDVQQEIQRNREFYKNADVRPPFTYASLIRQVSKWFRSIQSIIESPDKQLTLNEIYNWFQNTFCYFRRNAATWKNAIRTNLSLHKCFVRYEDDFGSFWMVDDSEFVKRRHLSRGRPRKYEPSSSPSSSNSQQFGSITINSMASNNVVDDDDDSGGKNVHDTIATISPDSSTAGPSSRQRRASSGGGGSSLNLRSVSKSQKDNENKGGNDDYDICEVSQRNPAGCQSNIHSGKKHNCGSMQRPHYLQGPSIIGVNIKTKTINSLRDHNHVTIRTSMGGGVAATVNEPGVGGIGNVGSSVGSLSVDNHNGHIQAEDSTGYGFHTQSISNDAILSSPTGRKSNNGIYSPNLQNMWSFGSSLTDEVTSAEFACINNDRYRNLVTGLHLQSLTQRHHFHQHKPAATHRMHPKTQQQQNILRNNISSQQLDARPLQQTHGYHHIYHTNPDEQQQKLLLDQHNQLMGHDIFGVNAAVLSNTDKYFNHNIESHNDGEAFKHEPFNMSQQQYLSIRHQQENSQSEPSSDEIMNHHLYIHHHNGHELDVKYTPPHKVLYNLETHNLNRPEVRLNKRPVDDIYSNKTSDAIVEEGSGIVDCERDEIQRKRKKNHTSSRDYENLDIKAEAEADSESELRNTDIPLRTKSY